MVDPATPSPAPAVATFHTHLDACPRCRNRPFDLCPVGLALLTGKFDRIRTVPRASWAVERVEGQRTPPADGQHLWHDCDVDGHVKQASDSCLVCDGGLSGCARCGQWEAQLEATCPGERRFTGLRATATCPDDGSALAVLEAPSVTQLLLQVARCGLMGDVEQALVLGAEIERVSRG